MDTADYFFAPNGRGEPTLYRSNGDGTAHQVMLRFTNPEAFDLLRELLERTAVQA